MNTDNSIVVGAILIGILLVGFYPLYVFGTSETIECFVDSKERITEGHGKSISSKYLIYCEEEVLENTDNLLRLKFGSSDIYRDLKEGNSYQLLVYGWRVKFLSMYRNIVKVND